MWYIEVLFKSCSATNFFLQYIFVFVLGLPDVKNMKDCVDWKREGFTTDGVYTITPAVATQIEVYCDMTTGNCFLFWSR
jgi:hypothetical protein